MAEREYIAHIRKNDDGSWDFQLNEVHASNVAEVAGRFAAEFGNADWAKLAGYWHDLGKYKPAFQEYIRKRSGFAGDENQEGGPGRVDHSTAGALFAINRMDDYGRVLAYLIAGHHAGLPDWSHELGVGGALSARLQESGHLAETLEAHPTEVLLDASLPTSSPCGTVFNTLEKAANFHLWIRMLFSCLVDADFLDTESFMDGNKTNTRQIDLSSIAELYEAFNHYMDKLQTAAADTDVNRIRREILAECRKGAEYAPGMFSLTVPTGGGKTLSSMAFALEHAIKFRKKRVVIVIPYTSIIEQTAKQYRDIFGDNAVIEHHSNLDPEKETARSKLATENWDAPIIVTTNVQLFESLFASKASVCRKLHSLVNSVIILDEAQMLPPEYLNPILSSLKGLCLLFGASIVLCTATQPALVGELKAGMETLKGFDRSNVRELMSNPEELAQSLRRVKVRLHPKGDQAVTWEEIAAELARHEQVLCIVNTRKDCRTLYELLPKGAIHLSALMCGEHRSKVISEIKAKLGKSDSIRVVSTQLVEAGVDIDFPVVYRALAGLDSIAQAAGRCNREGKLNASGRLGTTMVFRPPKPAPAGLLRKGEDAGSEMIRCFPELVESLSPEAYTKYFSLFYSKVNSFDSKGIVQLLAGPDSLELKIQFRTAAKKFQLIDDAGQKSVIVWYEAEPVTSRQPISSESLIGKIERYGPDRTTMRRLQRFSVNIPERVFQELRNQGSIREVHGMEGLWVQDVQKLYDPVFGLRLEGPNLGVEDFIA